MTSPWSAPGSPEPTPGPAAEPPSAQEAHATAGSDGAARELVDRRGLFPLRPLGLGEILGAAAGLYRYRPRAVLLVSAVVFAIAGLITTVATGVSLVPVLAQVQSDLDDSSGSAAGSLGESLGTMGSSLLAGLVSLIAVQVVTCAIAPLAIAGATGREAGTHEAWASARRHGVRAVLAGLLISLMGIVLAVVLVGLGALPLVLVGRASALTIIPLLLGILLFAVAELWLMGRAALTTPAIVLEGIGPIAGLRRAFALTRGRALWRVLGIDLLLTVIAHVASQVVSGAVMTVAVVAYIAILVATQMSHLVLAMIVMLVLTMVGTFLANALTQPFVAAGTVVLYADQRMRREAWDVELSRAARDAQESRSEQSAGGTSA